MLFSRNVIRVIAVLPSLALIYVVREYWDFQAFTFHFSGGISTTEDPGIVSKDLTSLCNQTKWVEGLWLQCHSDCEKNRAGKKTLCGGLNNIRNRVQTCLRLSIALGAGLIIPRTETRDPAHVDHIWHGKIVDANTFWDTAYFQQTLQVRCPQLQLRFDNDLTGIDTTFDLPERYYTETPYYNHTFERRTARALEKAQISDVSATNQVVIGFGDPYIAWNYVKSQEQETIRKDLFESIRYNPHLLSLGSQILQSPELQQGYIGIHLRGESDWPSSFGKLKDQMRLYIEEIQNMKGNPSTSSLTTIYVSCGNQDAIRVFREKLELLGYTVHDKMSLLAGYPEISLQVENLLFDEKGAVEYQMQLKADVFMGPVMSSMSSLIAYARSVNDTEDFFEENIYPDSHRREGSLRRTYPKSPIMKGNSVTKLMVVNGDDIMNSFP